MPGVVVDGNDVLAVYEAVTEAVKRARKGEGPSLIECKTYRWRGHFEGDACTYRCVEELNEWMAKDPIPRFAAKLVETGKFTQAELDTIVNQIKDDVNQAVAFAEQSPLPDPSELMDILHAAFIFIAPEADPATHRSWVKTPKVHLLAVGVSNYAQAVAVAKELVEKEGIGAIELCGGFGHGWRPASGAPAQAASPDAPPASADRPRTSLPRNGNPKPAPPTARHARRHSPAASAVRPTRPP